jgi:hypothetical protein
MEDLHEKLFALRRQKALRVLKAQKRLLAWKDYGSRNDRTGKRTASSFINTSDIPKSSSIGFGFKKSVRLYTS